MSEPVYTYHVPPGYGDCAFIYVFDAQTAGLTNGQSYDSLGVRVSNGEFILRYISGINTMAAQFNVYDWLDRRFYASPANLGSFAQGPVILPEVRYFDNGRLQFDLGTVNQAVAGSDGGLTVYRSQILFQGAKRIKGAINDPPPSDYKYREEDFAIPYDLTINNYASSGGQLLPPVRHQIPINNYDFELRRIELALQSNQQLSQFKIWLYDQVFSQRSNLPVLSNYLCHTDPRTNSGELGFFPQIPILYKVNTTIQFDIFSLLFAPVALPQTFRLLFKGVRRYPC